MAMKVPDRPTPALQGREEEGEWREREAEGSGGEEKGGEGRGKESGTQMGITHQNPTCKSYPLTLLG